MNVQTLDVSFKKSDKSARQFVYLGDKLIGSVAKQERWTVRGNAVQWDAYRKGSCVGSGRTRKEAAEILRKIEEEKSQQSLATMNA
jgi:hypothetical protein